MLIPDRNGQYSYESLKVTEYHGFVDTFGRIIEIFMTEDGRKWKSENNPDELNDIEKYVCRQYGWNLETD